MIVLLRRSSWKGNSLVTLGKLYIFIFQDLLKDRAHQVNMKLLLKRWSWKGHSLVPLGRLYTACSLFMCPKRQSFKPVILGKLCIFIVQISQETELGVDMILLFEGWSSKCHSSVILGKTVLCILTVKVSQETEVCVSIVLLRRWSWKKAGYQWVILIWRWSWRSHSSVTLGKALNVLCSCFLVESAFNMKYGLENSIYWCHWGSLWTIIQISGDRALSWYERWSWKGHSSLTGEKICICMFIVQVSWETEFWVNTRVVSYWWHWGRLSSAYSLFRSHGDSSLSPYNSFT